MALVRVVLVGALLLATATRPVAAGETDVKFRSDAARRAKAKFDKEIEQAEAAYRKRVYDAQARLLNEMEPAMANATRHSDLPEANRIDALMKAVTEEMKAGPRKKGGDVLQPRDLAGRQFHFWVVPPPTLTLTLRPDMTIGGATHANETAWRINPAGQLEVGHADGRSVTTRFERVYRSGPRVYLEGPNLNRPGRVHALGEGGE